MTAPRKRSITRADFERLCRESRVVESHRQRPSVLEHELDGRALITKIWYPKGWLSSDRLRPYGLRFVRSAGRLRALGFPAPDVTAYGTVLDCAARYVTYAKLPGQPLRSLDARLDLEALATFAARLHEAGVYFRALHLGNLLHQPDGSLALIDVAATRFRRGALGLGQRERNLGALCAHPDDAEFWLEGRWSELVMAYARAAGFNLRQAARLRDRVGRQIRYRQRRRTRRGARRARLAALAGR
ncbi:MAG: hypothetical protein R3E86_12825 [Pseudomonadales bacterium]